MLPEFEDPKKQISATFELLPVKNQKKTKEAGRPIYDDVEHCVIRFAGNRLAKGVFPAHEVFTRVPDPETGDVVEMTYALMWNDQYKQFKNGDAQTVSGTPLTVLPLVTPGKRLELKAMAIHTVETLAGIDGQQLKSLGMGGRDLKVQAQAYLDNAAKLTDTSAMKDELETLRAQVASLTAGQGAETPAAAVDANNPFADYEPEDIVNWIKTASPTTQIDGRWKKNKLMEVAADINAKLKAAA